MRVPIRPRPARKEEVRRRLRARSHEIGQIRSRRRGRCAARPGRTRTGWICSACRAMGQGIDGSVIIEDAQVIFEVNLPPALSFVEPMVASAIRQQGQKLIAPK